MAKFAVWSDSEEDFKKVIPSYYVSREFEFHGFGIHFIRVKQTDKISERKYAAMF